MIIDLVTKSRSYRRFQEDFKIDRETLMELVNLARLSASGGNLQPLKYIISCDSEKNALIFPHLSWARYLQEWSGPSEGERPSAYIIVLGDTEVNKTFGCDHGIASQSILLGAVEKGLGGCMIGFIQRERLRQAMQIPAQYEILLVLAIGKSKEKIILETVDPGGDIKYWRDSEDNHHVPKRRLEDIIIG